MKTIFKQFEIAAKKYNKLPIVYYKKNGAWKQKTYEEFLKYVNLLAGFFLSLGIKRKTIVAIMSENRPEWLASDLAINKLGAVSVPINIIANQNQIKYILNDSESEYLIISKKILEKKKKFIDSLVNVIKIIIINDNNIKINDYLIYNNFEKIEKKQIDNLLKTTTEKVATIIYTSGTSGLPRGVMLSNKNILTNIESLKSLFPVKPSHKFLSFLPLSHILERNLGSIGPILNGASIAYTENINQLSKNMLEIKPTVMICVPKFFEYIHKKFLAKINKKNFLFKKIIHWIIQKDNKSIFYWLANKIIYKKIRNIFGGQLRLAASGGASINLNTLNFFQKAGIKILEGYGLTEASPVVSANSLNENKIGTAGKPLSCVKIKIASDKEILIKGDSVMLGYWKDKEANNKAFKNGWFKTGDCGFLDNEKFLIVMGRKKDIIVTSNGKKIYPEKIEMIINQSLYISQSIIIGHNKPYIAALIIIDKKTIADKLGREKNSFAEINNLIKKEISLVNNQLMEHEKIKKFHILDKEFSIEENELTTTMKIRRKIIEEKNKKLIDKLFEKNAE